MNSWKVVVLVLTAGAATAAGCSSKSSSSGLPSCQNPSATESAQTACFASNSACSAYVSDVEANCGAYLSCIEACQCSSTSCQEACVSSASTTCQAALESGAACTSACVNTGQSSGGSSTGSSTGSGSSSSSSAGGSTVSCEVAASHWCFSSKNVPSSLVSSLQDECTSAQMGVVGTGCPTTDVVGCCYAAVDGFQSGECYYSGGSSTFTAASVMSNECINGSTFSAMP